MGLLCAFFPQATHAEAGRSEPISCPEGATRMERVDLFFGAAHVGQRSWSRFLSTVVTPRFPDGLTTYDGHGQWRSPRGLLAERTRILVIYYRPDTGGGAKIDAIRTTYKHSFTQSSVLRADSSACVRF